MHAVTSSTVYGAAGDDTIKLGGTAKNNYIDAGTGVVDFDAGAVTSSTIIGAASNDSFDFTGAVESTSIVGGEGANYIAPDGGAFTASTVTSGASNDTFKFAAVSGSSSIIAGGGNDTIDVTPLEPPPSWLVLVLIQSALRVH